MPEDEEDKVEPDESDHPPTPELDEYADNAGELDQRPGGA